MQIEREVEQDGPAMAQQAWAVYDQIIAEGTVPTRTGSVHRVHPTGLSRGGVETLREIVGECSPSMIVETGFAYGLSSLAIMASSLEAGADPRTVEHVAIDPYAASSWGGAGELVIERAGLTSMFRLIEEDSAIALAAMLRGGSSISRSSTAGIASRRSSSICSSPSDWSDDRHRS